MRTRRSRVTLAVHAKRLEDGECLIPLVGADVEDLRAPMRSPIEIGSIDASLKHSILFFGHGRPQFLKLGEEQLENRRGVRLAVTHSI